MRSNVTAGAIRVGLLILVTLIAAPVPVAGHAVLEAHVHEGICGDLAATEPITLDELGYVTPLLDPAAATPAGPFRPVGPEGAFPTMVGMSSIERSLDDLVAAPHAIDVHIIDDEARNDPSIVGETENADIVLTCGNIGGVRNGDDLVFGLQSAAESNADTAGIVWLHANGDGTTTVRLFIAQGLAAGGYGAVPTPAAGG